MNCPCGKGKDFRSCCGRYLGGEPAADAETLMRSRYTAYVLGDEAYLLATWHESSRPSGLGLKDEPPVKWIGLTVKRHESLDENHAVVEFVARYKIQGRAHRMVETSRFVRMEGRWYYLDGEVQE